MDTAAWVLLVLLSLQVVFQTKLASGAPLGRIAYGGIHPGKLPKKYRVISGFAVLLYLFFISVVLAYLFRLNTYSDGFIRSVCWLMAIFFGVGTVANAISPSRPERWWSVYTLAALLCNLWILGVLP